MLRSDRVELSKNLIRGFLAFDELLEACARMAGAGRLRGPRLLVARIAPGVPRLPGRGRARRRPGERALVSAGLHADRPRPRGRLRRHGGGVARYDVLVVNPVRDGLNLVAKEGPALNQRDGALVLSREAGAYDELADVAIGVNPFDVTATAAAARRPPSP